MRAFLFLSGLPSKINPAEDHAEDVAGGAGGKEVRSLKASSLETTDIFRGAFFLCRGAELSGIRFRNNHAERDRWSKPIGTFLITGEGLDRLDKQYRNGQALVNPLQFRESLNHLRDILFEKLREQDEGERYDRKRKNRGYQKRR